MQDLPIRVGDDTASRSIDGSADIGLRHFLFFQRDHALSAFTGNMSAGDPGIDGINLHGGHQLGIFHGALDGFDRALHIHDHAFFQAVGGMPPESNHIDRMVFQDFPHDDTNFGGPNV